jgi:hypothetical protein
VNLTQASRASGRSRKKLKDLIAAGQLQATRGRYAWEIDDASLAAIIGEPDMLARQKRLEDALSELQHMVMTQGKRLEDAEEEIQRLKRQIASKPISRRQLAGWLGKHGFNEDSLNHVRELDQYIDHTLPLNQQAAALRFMVRRFQHYPSRFTQTTPHEDEDATCVCHQVLPNLLSV